MKNTGWRRLKTTVGNHDGFTLLETMIGMVVFIVGIVPIMYMQVAAFKDHADSRKNVTMIQGTVSQAEVLVSSWRYDDDKVEALGGNETYGYVDMPVGVPHEDGDAVNKQDLVAYTVETNGLVPGLKMAYISNRINAKGKMYVLGQPVVNTKNFLDR